MNAKLFKKLNEQVEINNLKNVELTEAEKKAVETKVVFENFTQETEKLLEFKINGKVVDYNTWTNYKSAEKRSSAIQRQQKPKLKLE